MNPNQIFASLALASLAYTAATPQSKVLSLNFNKVTTNVVVPGHKILGKRTVDEPLINNRISYEAIIYAGTPPQKFTAALDTGSSDLWITKDSFNPDNSSTWKDIGEPFEIKYLDQTGAKGEFGKDTLVLGDTTVSDVQFASTPKEKNGPAGVFGIGYSNIDYGKYPNVPQVLKSQGVIESVSYSLWIDNLNIETDGSILFGGVDHARYKGKLGKLPITFGSSDQASIFQMFGYHTELSTILSSISLTNEKGVKADIVTGASMSVVLDTGSTTGVLPSGMVKAIADSIPNMKKELNSQYVYEYSTDTVPKGTITFNFLGVEIELELSNFFTSHGDRYYLGVVPGDSPLFQGQATALLGDTFLSNAYVAYDLETNEIALANILNDKVKDSDIEVIGSKGIPGTAAPSYHSTELHDSFTTKLASIF